MSARGSPPLQNPLRCPVCQNTRLEQEPWPELDIFWLTCPRCGWAHKWEDDEHTRAADKTKGVAPPGHANAFEPKKAKAIVSRMIGIDLGTMNSRVAIMEDGVPRIVPNREGALRTPSVVAFTATGERLVGSPASRQALTNAHGTVNDVDAVSRAEVQLPGSRRGAAVGLFLPHGRT